jgi:hypothetical protein
MANFSRCGAGVITRALHSPRRRDPHWRVARQVVEGVAQWAERRFVVAPVGVPIVAVPSVSASTGRPCRSQIIPISACGSSVAQLALG